MLPAAHPVTLTEATRIRTTWLGEPYKLPALAADLDGIPVIFAPEDQKERLFNLGILVYFLAPGPSPRKMPTRPLVVKLDGQERAITGAVRSRRLITLFLEMVDQAELHAGEEERMLEEGPIKLGS